MMAVSSRRLGRVIALQALYEVDAVDHDPQEVVTRWAAERQAAESAVSFARELVRGVLQEREELDTLLQGSAPLFPVPRIAPVDRAVLRLAIYELLRVPATPAKVAINEAVELAKQFGGDNSSRFVNGVLGDVLERHGAASVMPVGHE
jgi:transcription antitermination protein NusB